MRRLLLVTMTVSLSATVLVRAADDLVIVRFNDYLDALRTQAGIPGLGVALLRSVEGNWEQGLGQADVEHALPARPDMPLQVDGTTQIVTAAIVLRCVEEGKLSLDDRVDKYAPGIADGSLTIRQVLSHTSGSANNLVFSYRPDRLNTLLGASVVACTGRSLRQSFADLLDRFAMVDSVPGPDVLTAGDAFPGSLLDRFRGSLARLAKPYAVDSRGRPSPSQYAASMLAPAAGLISTARDLAKFDLSLRQGAWLRSDSLALAWTAPADANGSRLPHGLGWFVQSYNGERLVWQFGVGDNASSSMILTLPSRGMTLVLVANSQGLARPFSLSAGDVTVSPFAKLFLSVFVR